VIGHDTIYVDDGDPARAWLSIDVRVFASRSQRFGAPSLNR
jgi:hypothetical protein